eukprot:6441933-Alexandrium_andersonii.AAC.1
MGPHRPDASGRHIGAEGERSQGSSWHLGPGKPRLLIMTNAPLHGPPHRRGKRSNDAGDRRGLKNWPVDTAAAPMHANEAPGLRLEVTSQFQP